MLYYEDKAKEDGFSLIIGVDEVGRGPLAGPVVACAASLKKRRFKSYIDDSKKLTSAQREVAFLEILNNSLIGIGIVNEKIIDRINILNATKLAMKEAVVSLLESLAKKNNHKIMVLVDGNVFLDLPYRIKSIIKGDSKSKSIAAASIIAKVVRDRIMSVYDKAYPEYNFAEHKGYGTEDHFRAIDKFGPCSIHRMTFNPLNKSTNNE